MELESGYKTRQRDLILQCLKENQNQHLTVDEIMELLRQKGESVGRATVYRYLDKLVGLDLIHKYTMENGQSACYEYRPEHEELLEQFHLKCVACGKLFHMRCEHLKDLSEHIQQEHAFVIDPYKTIFYGRCGDCVEKETN